MSRAKYSGEFKEQVVLEVIEKGRSVTEVASSYDLVPQTVRNWIGKYRREHATEEDSKAVLESAEIARLKNELRELRQGCEFLKKQPPFSRRNGGEPAVRAYQSRRRQISDCFDVPLGGRIEVRLLLMA